MSGNGPLPAAAVGTGAAVTATASDLSAGSFSRYLELHSHLEDRSDDDDAQATGGDATTEQSGSTGMPSSVSGSIRLNGEVWDVNCDCTDGWKEAFKNSEDEEVPSCVTPPTKFTIQRIDIRSALPVHLCILPEETT